ncbi:MAG: hypothetical protein M1828_001746 [Chrysothrix sp. TS-e1954]|nr:MAG: hypothetical protein M1828_001746 [Chrysothrix sp. TS-e1954]
MPVSLLRCARTVPVSCLRMRTKPSARRALLDTSAFTDISFLLFTAACVIGYCGLYVTIFYASFYGENQHILSSRMAFYLVPILNAASVLGRTVPNWLSDHFGPLNIMAPSAMIMGVLTFCFIAADHAAALIALSVLYGAFSGVYLSLPGVVMFSITKDKTRIGTRVGMSFCAIGLGILAGGPGGGGILGSEPSPSDWEHAWTYAGVCALASSFVLFGLRFYRSGRRIMVKV